MKHIFIFITLLFSCTKEDACKNYNLVTESSFDSARQKCNGLAGNYPEFKTIETKPIGCLTLGQLTIAKKGESSETKFYCIGVSYTVRTVIR